MTINERQTMESESEAEPDLKETNKSFYVYLLETADQKQTYVGATVNLDHRLRQHNGEIKGGAKATSKQLYKGAWHRPVYVSQFPTWQSALQFEWRWKQLTRTTKTQKSALYRRLTALHHLLNKLDRSTSKSIPYSEWSTPPQIHFATDTVKEIYHSINNNQINNPTN